MLFEKAGAKGGAGTATRLFVYRKITHGKVCEGFLRDTSLKRLQQRRNRYTAFFAKLFFTRKKSGLPKNYPWESL
jgi:hypothetical protein